MPAEFVEKFRDSDWWRKWHDRCGGLLQGPPLNTRIVDSGIGGGKALKVTIQQDDHYGVDFGHSFASSGIAPTKITFRYNIMFDDTWKILNGTEDPGRDDQLLNQTGKLPGLAAVCGFGEDDLGFKYAPAGAGGGWATPGSRPNGSNGRSARMAFSAQEAGVRLGYQVYHVDQEAAFGPLRIWSRQNNPDSGLVSLNKWHAVGGFVRVNTPRQEPPQRKEEIDGKLNGYLSSDPNDVATRHGVFDHLAWWSYGLRFCWDRLLPAQTFWFNVYHGGGAKASRALNVYFSDIYLLYTD